MDSAQENYPMNTTTPLNGSHLRTYDRIFQHPISHNLEWRDVHSLLGKLGEVAEEHNGTLKITRNGRLLVLHAPRNKDIAEMNDIMTLRHFLERSETAAPEADEKAIHWLLVIDHHEARIFHAEISGGIPQQILPHKPEDNFRHAHNSKEVSRGQERPDPNSFFEPVARALQAPGPILIFGTGKGTSSEMEQFVGWSNAHHPEMAKRIIGTLTVDEHHLTEGQLLAKAQEFYANAHLPEPQNA
jgi:hypothetical protein